MAKPRCKFRWALAVGCSCAASLDIGAGDRVVYEPCPCPVGAYVPLGDESRFLWSLCCVLCIEVSHREARLRA